MKRLFQSALHKQQYALKNRFLTPLSIENLWINLWQLLVITHIFN